MVRPVVQFTRLTNAGRLSDRFVACQVREFYEAGFDGQARLFVLVEIVRPWLAASQIGQALIHAFTTGYRDATEIHDDLKHVEAALKRVNETLVHLAQQGETEWIGHLHAVFMVEKAGLVHVAQTGRAGAYLWREGKLSRITELEAAQSAATANRTFANITSGTLEPDDRLVIGSAEFLRVITPDGLEQTLRDVTPAEAVGRYARLLRQHQTRGAAAVVVRAFDPRILEQQPLVADPDVIYLDEQPMETLGMTLKSFGRKLQRGVLALGHQFARVNRAIDRTVRTQLAPRGSLFVRSDIARVRAGLKQLTGTTLPLFKARLQPLVEQASARSKQTVRQLSARVRNHLTTASRAAQPGSAPSAVGATLIGKDLYTVRHYTQPRRSGLSLTGIRLPTLRRLPGFTLPRFATLVEPRHRPRLYVAVALVLTAILVANIYVLRSKQRSRTASVEAVASVKVLEQQLDDLKLKLALNTSSGATVELTRLAAKLGQIQERHGSIVGATELAGAIEQTLDELTRTVRVQNPRRIASFQRGQLLGRLASDVVVADSSSPQLPSSPLAGELIDDRSQLPTGEAPRLMITVDQADELFVLSSSGHGYRLTKPGGTPTEQSVQSPTSSAVAVASFGGSLYFLDPSSNQIYKHPSRDGGYGDPSPFITDGTSVAHATALAIDGSIYVLTADGAITKLTRGKRDSFTLKGLPEGVSLAGARMLATDADSSSLYVLTPTSIVELSKSGQYVRRYATREWDDLRSFVVDAAAKQAWLLNGATVYEFNLQ